jgi:hypothetical protein
VAIETSRADSRLIAASIHLLTRIESVRSFEWNDFVSPPNSDDERLLLRVRPTLALGGEGPFRAGVEGMMFGTRGATRSSEFTLYQGWAEAVFFGGHGGVRAGRQELSYGSAFLLGADDFHNGQSFDAVKLLLGATDRISVDLFGGWYAAENSGGTSGSIAGLYGTTGAAGVLIDLYALRDESGPDDAQDSGRDRVWSLGTRMVAHPWDLLHLEVEAAWQRGRAGGGTNETIAARGGHVDVTIGRESGDGAGVSLGYAAGSGDGSDTDGTRKEFRNPNNDSGIIGDMGVIGDLGGVEVSGLKASGLRTLSAGGHVRMGSSWSIAGDVHWFGAAAVPEDMSRSIGLETNLTLTHELTESLSIDTSVNRFVPGGFVREASGHAGHRHHAYFQMRASF